MQEMKEELQKVFIETYGCQMNVNDSEVVASILKANGYEITEELEQADVVLVNTCSIRENAETRVFGRLDNFKQYKKKKPSLLVGVLGCMAERLKESLLEDQRAVDHLNFVIYPFFTCCRGWLCLFCFRARRLMPT